MRAAEGTPRGTPAREAGAGGVVEVRRLGRVPYGEGLRLQRELVDARRRGTVPDQLLLLEHPHVITLGTAARPEHLLAGEGERRLLGIEVYRTGRGGDVTYHGPGQLVGYPILDLKPRGTDLHRYLRDLEEVLIRAVARFGLRGRRVPGLTGVWLPGGKVAAIGVRVSRGWITSHGFALNVDPDLRYFETIVPCGVRGRPVTSLARELGRPPAPGAVADAVAGAFGEVFGLRPVAREGVPEGAVRAAELSPE